MTVYAQSCADVLVIDYGRIIFDFTLTDDELSEIAKVEQDKRYCTATEEAQPGNLQYAPEFNEQK